MSKTQKEITTEEWAEYLDSNKVTNGNIRFHLDQMGANMGLLKNLFFIQIPELNQTPGIPHEKEDVREYIKHNISMNLMYACKEIVSILSRIKHREVVKVLVAKNQENKVQMEFRGGLNPKLHISKIPDDVVDNSYNHLIDSDEDDISIDENVVPKNYYTSGEHVVEIKIVAGAFIITSETSEVLRDKYGINDLKEVTEAMVVFADACIACDIDTGERKSLRQKMQENSEKQLNKEILSIVGSDEENLKEERKNILQFLAENPRLEKDIPRGSILLSEESTYIDDYKNFLLVEMEVVNGELIQSMGKYFDVFKYHDVGDPIFNLPMMWTPVLAYLEGIAPYYREGISILSNDSYDRSSKVLYYGFSKGKIDALMKSYYSRVDCYDNMGKYEGLYEHGIKQTKIPYCTPGDVENYYRQNENVLVLNSYPKQWRSGGGNKEMVRYVSNLLRGKVPSGEREIETQGLRMAIRMVMPYKSNLDMMKGCYPFVVLDTCSPMDVEMIIVKLFNENEDGIETNDLRIKTIKMMFPGAGLKRRIKVINDKQEFICFLREMRMRRIHNLMLRIDNTKEWHRMYFGGGNRRWFLASPQIPYLCPYILKNKEGVSGKGDFG